VESIKEYFIKNRYFYIAIIVLLVVFVIWSNLSGSKKSDISKRTDSTMDRIETEAKSAGSAASDARREIENSQDSIRGAQDAVESGQRATEEVSDGIRECQDLAHESRKLNTDIAGLIRDIEAANRKRTQDSEKSPVAK
jgi:chromosome segregation ATPase